MKHPKPIVSNKSFNRSLSKDIKESNVKMSDDEILNSYGKTLGITKLTVPLIVEMHKALNNIGIESKQSFVKASIEGYNDGFNTVLDDLVDLTESKSHKELLDGLNELIKNFKEK